MSNTKSLPRTCVGQTKGHGKCSEQSGRLRELREEVALRWLGRPVRGMAFEQRAEGAGGTSCRGDGSICVCGGRLPEQRSWRTAEGTGGEAGSEGPEQAGS